MVEQSERKLFKKTFVLFFVCCSVLICAVVFITITHNIVITIMIKSYFKILHILPMILKVVVIILVSYSCYFNSKRIINVLLLSKIGVLKHE